MCAPSTLTPRLKPPPPARGIRKAGGEAVAGRGRGGPSGERGGGTPSPSFGLLLLLGSPSWPPSPPPSWPPSSLCWMGRRKDHSSQWATAVRGRVWRVGIDRSIGRLRARAPRRSNRGVVHLPCSWGMMGGWKATGGRPVLFCNDQLHNPPDRAPLDRLGVHGSVPHRPCKGSAPSTTIWRPP